MHIQSTADVALADLKQHAGNLPASWNINIVVDQVFYREWDAPSWIDITADSTWWSELLSGDVILYLESITRSTHSTTLNSRRLRLARLRTTPTAISRFAEFLMAVKNTAPSSTVISVGLLYAGCVRARFAPDFATLDDLEKSIAAVIVQISALRSLCQHEGLMQETACQVIQLALRSDFSLLVAWTNATTASREERVLDIADARC